MEIIDTNKPLLENLYLLSGPVLTLLGLAIFWQIKLAKKNIHLAKKQVDEAKKHLKTISKREAAAFAAKQTELFIGNIIELSNKIYKKKEEIKYPKFNGEIKDFNPNEVMGWDKEFLKEFVDKLLLLDSLDLQLINSLESFATYFTKGIADEEIAFSSIGSMYCEYVEIFYPLITIVRSKEEKHSRLYDNLIELYRIWKSRLDKFEIEKKLEKKQKEIEKELLDLEKMKKSTSDNLKTINPIGTN